MENKTETLIDQQISLENSLNNPELEKMIAEVELIEAQEISLATSFHAFRFKM